MKMKVSPMEKQFVKALRELKANTEYDEVTDIGTLEMVFFSSRRERTKCSGTSLSELNDETPLARMYTLLQMGQWYESRCLDTRKLTLAHHKEHDMLTDEIAAALEQDTPISVLKELMSASSEEVH